MIDMETELKKLSNVLTLAGPRTDQTPTARVFDHAPPIFGAPTPAAESVRQFYEDAACKAEQVADDFEVMMTKEIETARALAADFRKIGEREAEAVSQACERAAQAHTALDALRKGLGEGTA